MIKCSFENGLEVSLRHVTTGVIVVNDKEEVLLTKRAEHLSRGGKYTIPGGYLDRDETLEKGALRELKEETGYEGEIVALFHVNGNPNRAQEDRQNVDIIFLAKVSGGQATINSEATEIKWFKKEELPPEEEFAFDHRNAIVKFYEYQKSPFTLPLMGEISL